MGPFHSIILWRGFGTEAPGVNPGELRAQEKNLCRVVNPHQQNDERSGRAVTRTHSAFSNIEANQKLADVEQERRRRGANQHVAPCHRHPWQHLEDEGEQAGDDGEADDEVDRLQDDFGRAPEKS